MSELSEMLLLNALGGAVEGTSEKTLNYEHE